MDRPALQEIEITPEMIEAGVNAVSAWDLRDGFISRDEELRLIYRAMEEARRKR